MSVLVRKSHGLEGLLPLLKETLAHAAPVAESPHPGSVYRYLDSIPAAVVTGNRCSNMVADFAELVYLHTNGFPHPEELSFEEAACLVELEHALNRADRPREVELEVRISVFVHALQVPAVDRVDSGPNDLDVLVRNNASPCLSG